MRPLTIRPAAPPDADAAVALIRQSFRPEDLDLTIYGCSGIAAYLRMEFALPPALSASAYLVAEAGDRIAGFVEMRSTDTGLYLNYIAIGRDWRGAGMGRELLAAAVREIHPPAGAQFTLDVFEHNQAALDWYRRSGFQDLERMAFWSGPPRHGSPGPPESRVFLRDLPQADATHRTFGFSSFRLIDGGRAFTIGRLGERWFRITEGELLRRPGALDALRSLDPHREILFRGAGETAGFSPLLWSIRMGRQL